MKNAWKSLVLGALLTSVAACSGGGGSGAGGGASGSNDLVLSGKVGAMGSMNVSNKASDGVGKFGTYDNVKLYVTVYNDPPQITVANLGSDGSFSVTLPNASGTVIGAQFKNTLTNVVKHVYFQDSNKKDMNSSDMLMESYPLKGSVNFGTLDLSGAKPVIDVVAVIPAENRADAGGDVVGYDFSGSFKMASYSIPQALKDQGFVTAEVDNGGNNQSCGDEPCIPVDMPITLVKFSGKEFTKGAGCTENDCKADGTEGTVGTANKYGLSIWEGPSSGAGSGIKACGYKSGFTADSARFGAGIHIASAAIGSQAMTLADFTFGTLGGTEPWMKTGATAQYDVYDCAPKAHVVGGNTYNLHVCKSLVWADAGYTTDKTIYNVHEQGADNGCVEDSTNKPVMVSDWSITPDDMACWNGTEAFPGFKRTTCHYTNKDPDGGGSATATSFTCKSGHGTFADAALTTAAAHGTDYYTDMTRNGSPSKLLTSGGLCSSLPTATDAQKLASYQCYAQSYNHKDGSGCVREYRFNWAAKTSAEFVMTDGRPRPNSNFLTDIVTFSADGNTFFVNNNEKETVAITAGQNGGMEFCEIESSTKLVGKKMSDSQQLITLVQSGVLLSSDKTACVAAVNGPDTWENGNLSYRVGAGQKFMFLLNKQ